MRVKICGITQTKQGQAIAQLGATDLGFICVPASPRYVSLGQIQTIVPALPPKIGKIGVFANATLEEIRQVVETGKLTGVQLHGNESPEFCQELGILLTGKEIIKAFRLKNLDCLSEITAYYGAVQTLLLDAYHPQQLGGTGQTLNWQTLDSFTPPLPWLLAGGLTPDNILIALDCLHPSGIDLSSGVERSPGDKDLNKVEQLFLQLGH